jgi:protein-S-isoprenylcysteine O-methyltransferase Ste14
MLFIVIGAFGFVSLLVFDLLSLNNRIFGKYFFAFFGLGLILYSSLELVALDSNFNLHPFAKVLSLLFAIFFMALLIYSVFIEVGGNTYQKIAKPELVTNGTYSLVRHPGVIWLFFAFFFLGTFTQNMYVLIASIVWTIVNYIYVVIQEKYVLCKLFPTYKEYMKTTPRVIPNSMTMKKFFTTRNWRNE